MKLILIFSLVYIFGSLTSANALPMFAENRAIKTVSGAVLYPDSEDSSLVYYFPGAGNLVTSENGLRRFSLVYWGLSRNASGRIVFDPADSGGFLSFTSELAPTPKQKEEITARIGSNMHVAVLPVQKSTIEVAQEGTFGSKFFEEVNLPSHGGQVDAYIGLNSSLTGLGARMMVASLKGQESLTMKYCYETLGLSPMFKGDIDLNWSTIYETLKTSFSYGAWFWRSEVSVTIQKLIREGSLNIKIVAAPDSEAKYEEFVMKMANMLMERMFKNELGPVTPGNGSSGLSLLRVGLDYGRSETRESIHIRLERSELVKQNFCVPLSMNGISDNLDKYIFSADGISIQ